VTSRDQAKYNEFVKKYGEEKVPSQKLDVTKAKYEFMRWKCLTDLYYLGTEVLGLGKQRRKVYPKFHRWLCHVMSLDGDKMIIVPRKHAKTTWMKAYCVQRILRSAGKLRIMLLSKTELLSALNLASIKRFFALPLVRALFPEVVPDPGKDYKNWAKSTTNELRLKDDINSVSNEPQIIALGSAAKTAGLLNIDNRIMYTIGAAARKLKLLDADVVIGFPLSVTGKSPYFDR